MLIAGLIIAIIAIPNLNLAGICCRENCQKADKWPGDIQNIINDVQDNVMKDLEDANISISRLKAMVTTVEINTSTDKKDT